MPKPMDEYTQASFRHKGKNGVIFPGVNCQRRDEKRYGLECAETAVRRPTRLDARLVRPFSRRADRDEPSQLVAQNFRALRARAQPVAKPGPATRYPCP